MSDSLLFSAQVPDGSGGSQLMTIDQHHRVTLGSYSKNASDFIEMITGSTSNWFNEVITETPNDKYQVFQTYTTWRKALESVIPEFTTAYTDALARPLLWLNPKGSDTDYTVALLPRVWNAAKGIYGLVEAELQQGNDEVYVETADDETIRIYISIEALGNWTIGTSVEFDLIEDATLSYAQIQIRILEELRERINQIDADEEFNELWSDAFARHNNFRPSEFMVRLKDDEAYFEEVYEEMGDVIDRLEANDEI